MSERKENRNSLRSRRMIREAFCELLEEKSFSKITVTDIVKKADLNRSTFYSHYPDIYGILDEMQEEILQRNLQDFNRIQYRSILEDPMPYVQSITSAMEEILALLNRVGLSHTILLKTDRYKQLLADDIMNHSDIPQEVLQSPEFAIRVQFFLGGIMNAYQFWATGNLNCDLEQLNNHIAGMIRQTASDFFETGWNFVPKSNK